MLSKDVVVRPIISEKSLNQAILGEYTFEVNQVASKDDVKKALKELFGVDVTKVRTSLVKGRTNRVWGRRERTKIGPRKKATVILKKGQKLDLFEVST